MTNVDQNNLELSTRGSTSYKGVAYSNKDVWAARTKGYDNGYYIAVAGLNDEEKAIANKKTYMFHLGYFDDVRDAAFVAQTFDANREQYIKELDQTTLGAWDHPTIPTWEYEAVDTEQNVFKRDMIKQNQKAKKPQPKPIFTNEQLTDIRNEEAAASKLFFANSHLIPARNRQDFKDDLADVVNGKCSIEELIKEYK